MIDATNFVKINIAYKATKTVKGTRETVALLVTGATNATYSDYDSFVAGIADTDAQSYAKIFFDCGGRSIHVYPFTGTSNLPTFPDNEIVIAVVSDNAGDRIQIANAYQNVDGIHKKIVVGATSSVTMPTTAFGLCYKYVKQANIKKGYEMAIAAYLSRIDAYAINAVQDYCYTEEPLDPQTDQNSEFISAIDGNLNVNIELAGKYLNVGGNCMDGNAVVNEYMLILLQQTCTDRLINLLTQKIKGATGTVAIKAVLENELGNYVADGYLDTGKFWTDDDLTITYNNVEYTVIRKGTALDKGYYVFAVPYSGLSAADIAAHKAPPVYIIIADAYNIRTIEITGEVK